MDDCVCPEELYATYYAWLNRYVSVRVQDPYAAEDIIYTVFEKVLSSLGQYDASRGTLPGWIQAIAKNAVYDHYRKSGKVMPSDCVEHTDVGDAPDARFLREEEAELLEAALKTLSDRERNIVIQRFFHERTPGEIAEEMGLSNVNVRYLQCVALKKMRQHMKQVEVW